MRTLATLAIVACLLPAGVNAGRSPNTQKPDPGARSPTGVAVAVVTGAGSYSVTLDATATDARGRIVDNLKPADFELTVDGTPQTLETVSAVRDGAPPADGAGRVFAIFLDEFHTSPEGAAAAVSPLARFIDERLRPDDRIVVMKPLDSLFAIAPARDLAAVRTAVGAFDGRKGRYEPRNAFEQNFMGRSPEAIERLRRQVTVSAINALAVRLGTLGAGRKAILVVSEGFRAPAPVRGEELLPTIAGVVKNANRHNVAIYVVDPSGDSPDVEVLHTIASATDGQSSTGSDGPAVMDRMASDSSSYYLLTWRPAAMPDGRFHPVQLRVKRPGVRVRTRSGVWVLPSDEPLKAASTAARAASPFESTPRHVSPLIDTWFGMERGAEGRTRVTFVWEPNGRGVIARARRPAAPSSIAVKAFTLDGTSVYAGSVRRAGVTAETDAGAKAVFEAPPGRVHLQMSITGDDGHELDVDTRDIAVRDLAQGVALGTPAILRVRTALDFRTLAADLDAAPVAARTFSRAERLLVRFPAYAPQGDPVTVTARLVSRAGKTMRTFDVAPLEAAPDLRQIDLPLNGFAPGDYLLELSVSAAAGSAKELLNFRVTG